MYWIESLVPERHVVPAGLLGGEDDLDDVAAAAGAAASPAGDEGADGPLVLEWNSTHLKNPTKIVMKIVPNVVKRLNNKE